jgi:hypothetical protein
MWSRADQPSSTAKDHDADVSIHVKDGVTLRLAVTGGGKILLGEAGQATKKAARKDDGVGNGTIAFTFGAGTGAATLAIVYTPGDGSAPQSLPAGSGTLTVKEKITGGSGTVEISD